MSDRESLFPARSPHGQMFLCGAFIDHYAEWDDRRVLMIHTDRRKPKADRVTVGVKPRGE